MASPLLSDGFLLETGESFNFEPIFAELFDRYLRLRLGEELYDIWLTPFSTVEAVSGGHSLNPLAVSSNSAVSQKPRKRLHGIEVCSGDDIVTLWAETEDVVCRWCLFVAGAISQMARSLLAQHPARFLRLPDSVSGTPDIVDMLIRGEPQSDSTLAFFVELHPVQSSSSSGTIRLPCRSLSVEPLLGNDLSLVLNGCEVLASCSEAMAKSVVETLDMLSALGTAGNPAPAKPAFLHQRDSVHLRTVAESRQSVTLVRSAAGEAVTNAGAVAQPTPGSSKIRESLTLSLRTNVRKSSKAVSFR